ncbi:MAG: FAD-dependent oxidoreductase [Bdellovibrionales bacterium]
MGKRIVIVGGGTAGLSVMRNLHRKRGDLEITIIEPNETHYYQPLWTLVGGGVFPMERSSRPFARFVPSSVRWIKDQVTTFEPTDSQVTLTSGEKLSYDFLVVAPGIQLDWQKVEGLKETLGRNGVCSNYSRENVGYTWETMKSLKKGRALFTFPSTPIKCAGAPQKVMYLAEETFRDNGVRQDVEVKFVSAGAAIFGVAKYRAALEKVIAKRGINTLFKHDLVKIDGGKRVAFFKNMDSGQIIEEAFDMVHVTPPMSAPDFIKKSPLANEAGWVDVNKHTTQHNKFKNVFSCGDASSLPNSKTGAAIRKQGPVLVAHLLAAVDGRSASASYNGYASCPLVTSRSSCILAEFDYDGNPAETFPFDQGKERYSMYVLKKDVIPFMYWNAMMKGYF